MGLLTKRYLGQALPANFADYRVCHKFLSFGGSQIPLNPPFSKGDFNSKSLQFPPLFLRGAGGIIRLPGAEKTFGNCYNWCVGRTLRKTLASCGEKERAMKSGRDAPPSRPDVPPALTEARRWRWSSWARSWGSFPIRWWSPTGDREVVFLNCAAQKLFGGSPCGRGTHVPSAGKFPTLPGPERVRPG